MSSVVIVLIALIIQVAGASLINYKYLWQKKSKFGVWALIFFFFFFLILKLHFPGRAYMHISYSVVMKEPFKFFPSQFVESFINTGILFHFVHVDMTVEFIINWQYLIVGRKETAIIFLSEKG